MRKKALFWTAVATALALQPLAATQVFADTPVQTGVQTGVQAGDMPNFHVVTGGIWRSGRPPSEASLKALAEQGLRTILDLENDSAAVSQEAKWAKDLGLDFISEAMDSFQPVSTGEINTDLATLQSSSKFVILVHCEAGNDRTGLVIGLYRVLVQHWAPQAAYEEMISYGFHTSWTDIDSYFRQRTGWNGSAPSPAPGRVDETP